MENDAPMSYFSLDTPLAKILIGYPGNESVEVDTTIRHLLTNKATAVFMRQKIIDKANYTFEGENKSVRALYYVSVFLGDDANNQIICTENIWTHVDLIKEIARVSC